jgi:hypothetical protein
MLRTYSDPLCHFSDSFFVKNNLINNQKDIALYSTTGCNIVFRNSELLLWDTASGLPPSSWTYCIFRFRNKHTSSAEFWQKWEFVELEKATIANARTYFRVKCPSSVRYYMEFFSLCIAMTFLWSGLCIENRRKWLFPEIGCVWNI